MLVNRVCSNVLEVRFVSEFSLNSARSRPHGNPNSDTFQQSHEKDDKLPPTFVILDA